MLVLLTACGRQAETPANLQQTVPPSAQADPVDHVACARGQAPLKSDCTLERTPVAGGETWTIRHPDGSFRRLIVKGEEIETADGAERLRAVGPDLVVGDERYRLAP